MPMVEPLRTVPIFRAAQERIKDYIVRHELVAGDPIPTEAVLARELGISRTPLREALKALAAVGVVETRHGSGTYVGRASLAPLIDGVAFNLLQSAGRDTRTLREMLRLRETLEISLMHQVIGLHTPDQLARLADGVAQMEADAAQGIHDPSVDLAFHDALYEPLDNRVVMLILHAFWDVKEAVIHQLPALADIRSIAAMNACWHRAIFAAVDRGDAGGAAAAMCDHFAGIRTRLNLAE